QGLQLFPNGGFITTSVGSITASYDFSNFDGTSPTGALKLNIQNFSITIGDSVQISVPTITITPGQSVIASLPTATLSLPMFSGLGTVALNNFQLLQTGFSIGSFNFNSIPGLGSAIG